MILPETLEALTPAVPNMRISEVLQPHVRDGLGFVVAAGGDGTVAAAINGLSGSRARTCRPE